jgi:hypothetical protein
LRLEILEKAEGEGDARIELSKIDGIDCPEMLTGAK